MFILNGYSEIFVQRLLISCSVLGQHWQIILSHLQLPCYSFTLFSLYVKRSHDNFLPIFWGWYTKVTEGADGFIQIFTPHLMSAPF